jgi:membrane protein DedA with SNARE-associated domain
VSGSSWSYVAIFVVSMLDAFFPIVPSETAVITGGVVASAGDLSLLLSHQHLAATGSYHVHLLRGVFVGPRLRPRGDVYPKCREIHIG